MGLVSVKCRKQQLNITEVKTAAPDRGKITTRYFTPISCCVQWTRNFPTIAGVHSHIYGAENFRRTWKAFALSSKVEKAVALSNPGGGPPG